MTAPAPYKLALIRHVLTVGRCLPDEPLGGLVNSIIVWRRLPRLVRSRDGAKWIRQAYDTKTGEALPVRPNQFACLIKRTASTHAETAILTAALHRVAKEGVRSA